VEDIMVRALSIVAGLLLLPLLGACSSSPYVDGFDYTPRPAIANLPSTSPQTAPPVAAYAALVGVRREDKKQGIPESVEVRLQLDNNGPQTLTFNPQSLHLTDGELLPFGPPVVFSPPTITLAPAQSATVSAFFPFPPGRSYDSVYMDALDLRWFLQLDDRTIGQAVKFTRFVHVDTGPHIYYDPYWGYAPFPVFGGVVVVRHRW